MSRVSRAPTSVVLLFGAGLFLGACADAGGSGWGLAEAPPSGEARTMSRRIGEQATFNGPNSLRLLVSLDFTSQPTVPITLSPEDGTFLEVHLTVTNTGTTPFSGVLADAADLAVLPAGTLAPVRTENVPSEIALSGGLDFAGPVTFPPGSPAMRGKVVFQIDPDDQAASFALSIGLQTVRWDL